MCLLTNTQANKVTEKFNNNEKLNIILSLLH